MGGTSTDIALLQGGEPQLTGEKTVGLARVALPSLDIHTLGAGGGSIARVDAGGILHVGPESAGADPGPACYGKGGTAPTVTDANLVLGLLDPANFLGGRIAPRRGGGARARSTRSPRTRAPSCLAAAEGIVAGRQHQHGGGHPARLGPPRRRPAAASRSWPSAAPPACT